LGTAGNITPFDFQRIFLGEGVDSYLFLAEVLFRTSIMFSCAIVFARLVGKRAVGEISPIELVLVIIVGSAAGDPMFYPHVPLLHGILVLAFVSVLHRAFQSTTKRWQGAEASLEGEPIKVISDGSILEGELGRAGLSRRDLMMLLRGASVADTGEIEHAYFEPSGRLSIFSYARSQQKKMESTLPS